MSAVQMDCSMNKWVWDIKTMYQILGDAGKAGEAEQGGMVDKQILSATQGLGLHNEWYTLILNQVKLAIKWQITIPEGIRKIVLILLQSHLCSSEGTDFDQLYIEPSAYKSK